MIRVVMPSPKTVICIDPACGPISGETFDRPIGIPWSPERGVASIAAAQQLPSLVVNL